MRIKILKNAHAGPPRDMCPWMITIPPESRK